jgi:hypothetical protein
VDNGNQQAEGTAVAPIDLISILSGMITTGAVVIIYMALAGEGRLW